MKQLTNMLGLAMRAGYIVSGEEQVVQKMRRGQARLVFLASDAGMQTAKKITDKAATNCVPVLRLLDRGQLGGAIGKGERVVVALTEVGFARQLLKLSQLYSGGDAFG
ncbi:L7Ae/L30e/S12e/Gadd45 family ribosomal protein [Numidum massiliense]|uniref:L7Ae/L30e/S12e/Gadd45 family ribosomal protein n=1 Tax=Numidum massiliense TaxID=1522315 RepID=UPI0006D55ADF|nr:ribosomal L7Ae/L30e/S12e/Gadd45 family protein [Numidum massiliense]